MSCRKSSGFVIGFLVISFASTGYTKTYTFTAIDFRGARNTYLYGINNSGEIVGSYEDVNRNEHGFLYAGGNFTSIDVLGSPGTYPGGINDSGEIVGYYEDVNFDDHGFLYAGGKFTSMDVPGASVYCPLGHQRLRRDHRMV